MYVSSITQPCNKYIIYYLAIKKEQWSSALVKTWMDPENSMLRDTADRERQTLYDTTYLWKLKKKTNIYAK